LRFLEARPAVAAAVTVGAGSFSRRVCIGDGEWKTPLCPCSPSPVVVAVYWAGLPIISQHTSTVHRPNTSTPSKMQNNKTRIKWKNRLTLHSIVFFSARLSYRFPLSYLNRLRGKTHKGWNYLIRIAESATWLCSLTTLFFCYRENPRRREFVVPSFRSRSPTRSQSFSVAVPSAAVRVNQWPRSPKSLQTPSVPFFPPFHTGFRSS
jgi:hypothetical protein